MKVKDLLKRISSLKEEGVLTDNSNVTVHMYVDDGVAVEWKDELFIECHGPNDDGFEINFDMPEWMECEELRKRINYYEDN